MNWVSGVLRRKNAVEGHRVLYVNEKGPGAAAGLVPFCDIVTSVDGIQLNDTDNTLASVISKYIEKKTEITVYNIKTKAFRKTQLTPTPTWGGPGCLGIVARHDTVDPSQKAFLVTDVLSGGPADEAGCKPGEDYILGSDRMSLHNEEDLAVMLLAPRKTAKEAAVSDTKPRGESDASEPPTDPGTPVVSELPKDAITGSSPLLTAAIRPSTGMDAGSSTLSLMSSASETSYINERDEILVLYVYNSKTDSIRTVAIQPSRVPLAAPETTLSFPSPPGPRAYGGSVESADTSTEAPAGETAESVLTEKATEHPAESVKEEPVSTGADAAASTPQKSDATMVEKTSGSSKDGRKSIVGMLGFGRRASTLLPASPTTTGACSVDSPKTDEVAGPVLGSPARPPRISFLSGSSKKHVSDPSATNLPEEPPGERLARPSRLGVALSSITAAVSEIGQNVQASGSFKKAQTGMSALSAVTSARMSGVKWRIESAAEAASKSMKRNAQNGTAWFELIGVRIQVMPALPPGTAPGHLATVEDLEGLDPHGHERMERLGVDDMFVRLTGMTAAAMMAEASASVDEEEPHGDSKQPEKDSNTTMQSSRASADEHTGLAEKHQSDEDARSNKRAAKDEKAADKGSSSDDESTSASDSDDGSAKRKTAAKAPLRKTRGALKRASEEAARAKARAMGMGALGDSGPPLDLPAVPEKEIAVDMPLWKVGGVKPAQPAGMQMFSAPTKGAEKLKALKLAL